jgi:uncharacterized membrane protein
MIHKAMTLWRQHLLPRLTVAHIAASLLICAGAFANFRYGITLGQTDLEKIIAGAASVGADLFNAVGLILVTCAFQNRLFVQGLAGLAVLAMTFSYSLNAGFGFASTAIEQTISTRTAIKNDQAAIAALGSTRPSGSIEAEMSGILADPRAGGCEKINGPYTREHCPRYFELKEELGRAIKAEDLARNKRTEEFVVSVDPTAANVAFFLDKVGIATNEDAIRPWQTLIFVFLVVIGGPIVLWLAESRVQSRVAPPEAPKPAEKASQEAVQAQTKAPEGNDTGDSNGLPEPPTSPSRRPARKSNVIRLTPAATQTLNRIIQEGGEVRAASQNALAKALDISRTTLRRAIENLEEAGQILVDNDNGLRLAVA